MGRGGGGGVNTLDPEKFFREPLAAVSTRIGRREREEGEKIPNPFERMMRKMLERN